MIRLPLQQSYLWRMSMSKKTIFYIIFFSVLVVGFYMVMSFMIPDFSKPKLIPISTVQPFQFTNQDGQAVTQKDVYGKVYVVDYFFTTCKGICPKMKTQLKRVYEKFNNEKDFLILSHTCDPGTDSVQTLRDYSTRMGVDTKKWIFLTGRKDSLYNMARFSYKIDDPANNLKNADEDFMHTQFFALVDREGNVRKIYDGIVPAEVSSMMKDITRLLKE